MISKEKKIENEKKLRLFLKLNKKESNAGQVNIPKDNKQSNLRPHNFGKHWSCEFHFYKRGTDVKNNSTFTICCLYSCKDLSNDLQRE